MKKAEEILSEINEYLANLPYDRKPYSLYEPIKYVLSIGGKRIRPSLVLMAYNLYQDDVEKVLPVACALETYHNYTLLHDDLMDHAPLRRGHQTVHERWNSNTAILSGDSMLVMAFQRMMECPDSKLRKMMSLFAETALQIGEGQEYDMNFESRTNVTEEEYIEMIRLKTSVLLACSVKMGAIMGDASVEDQENLYKFGELMGLAFQLQDDFLDVYGDSKVFGKAIGGDIISNKKTYMLINAFNLANDEQRRQLVDWTSRKEFVPQDKIVAVKKLYDDIGIDRLAKEKIDYFFQKSKSYLGAVHVSDDRKAVLAEYTDRMMHRNK